MPAHVVTKSVKQLADRTGKFLKENGLGFKDIQTYSTPRRLTVLVKDLAEKQADVDEVKKGPAKRLPRTLTATGPRLPSVLPAVKG